MTGRRYGLPGRRLASAFERQFQHLPLLPRLASSLLLMFLSLGLVVSSASLDHFLNRGIVYGLPEYGDQALAPGGGPMIGMNVFLEKEVDPANVTRSIQMLKDAHVSYVRQSFPWAEIEPAPGIFVAPHTNQSTWAKYDAIVDQLSAAGIGILARIDTIPRWARPPDDDFERWDKGPPQDFNNYGAFVARLAGRYRGKITYFQIWNEPNLTGEWGGKPIDPAQYALLLKMTTPKVKAINPDAQIVTAGLAQTDADGKATNNLNELDFIQGLYAAGAQPYFDILSVMAYGLGSSPEDRRVGHDRVNFSRLQLAREVMLRNGDADKPIWISEYGWLSLPDDWRGRPGTWGKSVDEATQAQWTIEGLERIRAEWPWVGAVFVWAFRFIEPPTAQPDDPARYFEVVDHDFTPRPAYVALRNWSSHQAIATMGSYGARDPRFVWDGPWREQTLGGSAFRVSDAAGATVRIAFHGTAVSVHTRTGPSEGRLYATIDGQSLPDLRTDGNGSYLILQRTGQADFRTSQLAMGLPEGDHLLELRAGESGQISIVGIVVGHQRPFDWLGAALLLMGIGGLFIGFVRLGRTAAYLLGLLHPATPARWRAEWWDIRE